MVQHPLNGWRTDDILKHAVEADSKFPEIGVQVFGSQRRDVYPAAILLATMCFLLKDLARGNLVTVGV